MSHARRRRFILFPVLALTGAVSAALAQKGSPVADRTAVARAITGIVASGRHSAQRWPLLSDVTTDLRALYRADSASPLWSTESRATASARLVIDGLERLGARGLLPVDYDAGTLRAMSDRPFATPLESARFDLALSVATLRALRALRFGRVSARAVHANFGFVRERYDAVAALRRMTSATNPSLQFDEAEPPFVHYRLLKEAIARHLELARDSTLRPVALSRSVRPEAVHPAMPQLRRLLAALGDVAAPSQTPLGADSLRYDSALVDGVRRFQLRHGYPPDGVIRAATLVQLNRSFSSRVAQMSLTLERWRWLPHALGDPPPIIVNVPAFRLHAFTTGSDRESELISMDVVVGQAFKHRTPVFTGTLRHLIFSPYWDIPPSILRKEILPKARRDRGFLARNHYEVVSNSGAVLGTSVAAVNAAAAGEARIRQRPGADNALGGVKFIFPNTFNVYMHDTPAQKIFARARRDASHGCIRLSEPARLARFLLRDQPGWDSTAIAEAMTLPKPKQVKLSRPVPVHVAYATTIAREDGTVFFFDDIYGHDRTLAALLARGYPYAGSRR